MFFRAAIIGVLLVFLGIYLGITNETAIKSWFAGPWFNWCPQRECIQTHTHDSHDHSHDHADDQVPVRSDDAPPIDPYDSAFEEDVTWLAKNIYFHRGGTNNEWGKKGVTAVVFNRMRDRTNYFGKRSIRGIITYTFGPNGCNCAFSWYCDGRSDTPADEVRYAHDRRLAGKWLRQFNSGTFEDPTDGATWFLYKGTEYPHAWPELEWTSRFGQYAFYRYP